MGGPVAHSNLLGGETAPAQAPGHDTLSLGPSDTSDSGSDLAGLAEKYDADPALATDMPLDPDGERPELSFETLTPGVDSDAGGAGERRSASGDHGWREADDISPDLIISRPDDAADLSEPLDGIDADDLAQVDDLAEEDDLLEGQAPRASSPEP